MRARELLPAFAEITGFPLESVKVADRSLADNGLRTKGRGPRPPEVTRQDVFRLLLGVSGSRVLSRAHEYVQAMMESGILWRSTLKDEGEESDGADAFIQKLLGFNRDQLLKEASGKKVKLSEFMDAVFSALADAELKKGREYLGAAINIGQNRDIEITFYDDKYSVVFTFAWLGAESFDYKNVQIWAEVPNRVVSWIAETFPSQGVEK